MYMRQYQQSRHIVGFFKKLGLSYNAVYMKFFIVFLVMTNCLLQFEN